VYSSTSLKKIRKIMERQTREYQKEQDLKKQLLKKIGEFKLLI